MKGVRAILIIVLCLLPSYILISCHLSNNGLDRRCPELVEKAEYFNAKVAYGEKEGPMGMRMRVEYVDSVYRVIQTVDESLIPTEKLKMFYGNQKPNLLAGISSATDVEREEYQLMVDYRVSFEHIVKSKNTGEVIVRTTITPEEIKEALLHEMSYLDKIKIHVKTAQKTLPREMESGYIMNEISCTDDIIYIKIIIDEDIKEFNEATIIRNWTREQQAVTLADLTLGLNFWDVASQVPMEFDFHFCGSKGNHEMHIRFTKDEVIEYNEVMTRIKDQQLK